MTEEVHDAGFGRLRWDPRLRLWLGAVAFSSRRRVQVVFSGHEDDLEEVLQKAREDLAWVKSNEKRARKLVADDLLKVYDQSTLRQTHPWTAAEVFRRLKLVRVGFLPPDDSLLLAYDGVDWFAGNFVSARFDPDRNYLGIDLERD
jgi:hypothetical protein